MDTTNVDEMPYEQLLALARQRGYRAKGQPKREKILEHLKAPRATKAGEGSTARASHTSETEKVGAPKPAPSVPRPSRPSKVRRAPDFAKHHEASFSSMKSLEDIVKRKDKRRRELEATQPGPSKGLKIMKQSKVKQPPDFKKAHEKSFSSMASIETYARRDTNDPKLKRPAAGKPVLGSSTAGKKTERRGPAASQPSSRKTRAGEPSRQAEAAAGPLELSGRAVRQGNAKRRYEEDQAQSPSTDPQ